MYGRAFNRACVFTGPAACTVIFYHIIVLISREKVLKCRDQPKTTAAPVEAAVLSSHTGSFDKQKGWYFLFLIPSGKEADVLYPDVYSTAFLQGHIDKSGVV